MNALIQQHAFLAFWLGILLINVSGIVVVLVWAIKSGQFSDQARARYLALEAKIPEEKGSRGSKRG